MCVIICDMCLVNENHVRNVCAKQTAMDDFDCFGHIVFNVTTDRGDVGGGSSDRAVLLWLAQQAAAHHELIPVLLALVSDARCRVSVSRDDAQRSCLRVHVRARSFQHFSECVRDALATCEAAIGFRFLQQWQSAQPKEDKEKEQVLSSQRHVHTKRRKLDAGLHTPPDALGRRKTTCDRRWLDQLPRKSPHVQLLLECLTFAERDALAQTCTHFFAAVYGRRVANPRLRLFAPLRVQLDGKERTERPFAPVRAGAVKLFAAQHSHLTWMMDREVFCPSLPPLWRRFVSYRGSVFYGSLQGGGARFQLAAPFTAESLHAARVSRPLGLLHPGPPGTGKTVDFAALIANTYQAVPSMPLLGQMHWALERLKTAVPGCESKFWSLKAYGARCADLEDLWQRVDELSRQQANAVDISREEATEASESTRPREKKFCAAESASAGKEEKQEAKPFFGPLSAKELDEFFGPLSSFSELECAVFKVLEQKALPEQTSPLAKPLGDAWHSIRRELQSPAPLRAYPEFEGASARRSQRVTVYASCATLVVIPGDLSLMEHWAHECLRQAPALRVCLYVKWQRAAPTDSRIAILAPSSRVSPQDVAQFDVLITSNEVYSHAVSHPLMLGKLVETGCACVSCASADTLKKIKVQRLPCFLFSSSVHWRRAILDEAHELPTRGKTHRTTRLARLRASSRFSLSGTQDLKRGTVTVQAHRLQLLKFLGLSHTQLSDDARVASIQVEQLQRQCTLPLEEMQQLLPNVHISFALTAPMSAWQARTYQLATDLACRNHFFGGGAPKEIKEWELTRRDATAFGGFLSVKVSAHSRQLIQNAIAHDHPRFETVEAAFLREIRSTDTTNIARTRCEACWRRFAELPLLAPCGHVFCPEAKSCGGTWLQAARAGAGAVSLLRCLEVDCGCTFSLQKFVALQPKWELACDYEFERASHPAHHEPTRRGAKTQFVLDYVRSHPEEHVLVFASCSEMVGGLVHCFEQELVGFRFYSDYDQYAYAIGTVEQTFHHLKWTKTERQAEALRAFQLAAKQERPETEAKAKGDRHDALLASVAKIDRLSQQQKQHIALMLSLHVRVLILSHMTVGIDLSMADALLNVEPFVEEQEFAQLVGRLRRCFGKDTKVIHVRTLGTYEANTAR